ncbi:MAG: 1-acyl-sn-glycerol-3-phosphate acyltransferase [Deltaproteobacteria bacterium]|nr:1-acyl-sn-glycerol-3-phosphate acyltransferase [Deltaproteobacteria bacterium]
MKTVSHFLRLFIATLLRPLYFHFQKKYPDRFNLWIAESGPLFVSAMLQKFNLFHRLMFRGSLNRIQIHPQDVEKIRQASQKGPVVYMMRNWGQVEYNFFNHLFLKENLPLATRANLLRMYWWMPLKKFFVHKIARLHFAYSHGGFPEDYLQNIQEKSSAPLAMDLKQEVSFLFLNLPEYLDAKDLQSKDVLLPLLESVQKFELEKEEANQEVCLIPLTFAYDHRPGSEERSLVDILFGERENPGTLRKLAIFFRHYKKHALAQTGNPISLSAWIKGHQSLDIFDQAKVLQKELHQIFHKEQKAITGPRLKDRKRMIDLVLQDKTLRQDLMALAQEKRLPTDSLYLEAEKVLEKIVADPNYTYIDLWAFFLRWVFNHVYEGLSVDEAVLQKIKDLSKKSSIVLIPSHRSHVDYLLLSYVFYSHSLSVPMVAAGENLSFWPMGYVFRKSGAYFIKRSFGDDKLYPLLFKAYVKALTAEGYFHEFFIEGTRSRSGKLEQPKTGLLSILMDNFLEQQHEDLIFVPISITYEKVLEEQSYFSESKGAQKKGESFLDLFKIRKHLKHRSGQIYVRFGEPISAKDFSDKKGFSSLSEKEEIRKGVRQLALEISKEINQSAIVTAPALISAALLASRLKGHSLEEICARLEDLQAALRLRNVNLSEALQNQYLPAIHQGLKRYTKQGLVSEHHDGKENFYVVEAQHRSHLNFYKNSLMTHVIHLSLLSFLLLQNPKVLETPSETFLDQLHLQYSRLSELFAFEFVGQLPFQEAWADLKSLNWMPQNRITLEFMAELSADLREAYSLALEFLALNSFVKWEEKNLIGKILQWGNILYLKGEITKPESLSQFILQNTMASFKALGLLKSHEKELGKRGLKIYSNFATPQKINELLHCFNRLSSYLPLEKEAPEASGA